MPEKTAVDSHDSSQDVLKALRAAARGLSFPSESDKPVKAFLWKVGGEAGGTLQESGKNGVDESLLRSLAKTPAEATVKTIPVESFFAPVLTEQDWFGEEEKKTAQRFRALRDVLRKHLTNLHVYRVEGADPRDSSIVTVYVAGRTGEGDLAGVSTRLVET